jgi:transposase-like protein
VAKSIGFGARLIARVPLIAASSDCRAVDVLDILVQSRRNTKAADRFFRKLFKQYGQPRVLVTDKLRSYGAAPKPLAPGIDHRAQKGLNNRTEVSHRPTRRQKRSWGGSNRTAKRKAFCPYMIRSKQSFALAATNYPSLPIDNLAQMLTAFGTTSRVS